MVLIRPFRLCSQTRGSKNIIPLPRRLRFQAYFSARLSTLSLSLSLSLSLYRSLTHLERKPRWNTFLREARKNTVVGLQMRSLTAVCRRGRPKSATYAAAVAHLDATNLQAGVGGLQDTPYRLRFLRVVLQMTVSPGGTSHATFQLLSRSPSLLSSLLPLRSSFVQALWESCPTLSPMSA